VSIVWLVVIGLAAWTLVSVAVGLFIGKVIAAGRRGGYLEIPPFVQVGGLANVQATGRSLDELEAATTTLQERVRPYTGGEDQSAA
jgi:hypothetical protein